MALSRDRIIALGTSPQLHEQAAVNFVIAALPDTEPFRLWGLIDLVDPAGRRYDLDLLVIGYYAVYLIEIKSHPGTISGDVVDWSVTFPDGGRTTLEHPGRLAEYKSRVLASLLQKQMSGGDQQPPWVQHLIFASAEGVKVNLSGAARNHIVTRETLLRALQFGEYPGATPRSTRDRINRPQAVETVKALTNLGLRPSHASRKVNELVLGKLLVEHDNYQDHLARHESIPSDQARVRTYQMAQGVTLERRKQLVGAAEREAQHLTQLSDHPNILKLRSYLAHGPTNGPCLVFEHLEGAVPLDAFLRANPDLSLIDKAGIVMRIGEALAYCHRKSILHRGLAPSSVLVRRHPDDPKKLDVRLFNFQLATQTGSASGAVHHTSHLTVWRRSNEDVYVAPEVLEKPENASEASDLFSLGALAYLILVGRPPGQDLAEREALFRRGYLSPATARDELAGGLKAGGDAQPLLSDGRADLEDVMQFATERNPISRGNDVLTWTDLFVQAITAPPKEPAQAYVDPLEAKGGDQIAPNVLVEKVLGTGSTARTLRIFTDDGTFALKVSLSPDLDGRLQREGEILKSVQSDRHSSDRIVHCHGIITVGGRTGLRLTDAGDTLARVLADEGAQSLDYARRWGDDLLRALEHLEERGVQHRDIKPGNLGILTAEQKRKRHLLLFDFSLSAADANQVRLGTPAYRDPFLAARGRWDDAADRYAAAITLHEILTGERPRWGAADMATATYDEITLTAERFDATVRDNLVAFFRKALARDLAQRFPTAERMHTEWLGCFATVRATPKADDDAADEADRSPSAAPMPVGMNLDTAVESLPLPARAKNALDRAGVLRVADLLRLPNNELSAMRGVGRKTAREILTFTERAEFVPLREALASAPASVATTAASSPIPTVNTEKSDAHGDVGVPRSVDGWLNAALPPVSQKTGEKPLQYVRYLWGLDPLKGRIVDSVADLAAALGVTRPLIYQAVEKMRQRWKTLPFLDELQMMVAGALDPTAGQAPLGRLGDVVTLSLDRAPAPAPDDRRGQALVRIAVETQDDLRLARIAGQPWVVPAAADVRVIEQLGRLADQLAQAEPLLSPGGAAAQLRTVVSQGQGPWATLADEPLVALAVAASSGAAKSARLEIYPRGLSPQRALDLCLSALPPAGLDPAMVSQVVGARYPEAQPLPQGAPLADLLLARGYTFDLKFGRFNRSGRSMPTDTMGSLTRAPTTHSSLRQPADPVADEFARDLAVREKRGSFCVLEVQPNLARYAAQELEHRLAVRSFSIEEMLLAAMNRVVSENDVQLTTVYAADRTGPAGSDWPNLRSLMEQAADQVLAQLRQHTRPLVLTDPGLLARYGLSRFLKQLVDFTRQDETPAVFLLVPSAEDASGGVQIPHPVGPLPVPLTSPAQHLRVPESWLKNLDRGRSLSARTAEREPS